MKGKQRDPALVHVLALRHAARRRAEREALASLAELKTVRAQRRANARAALAEDARRSREVMP